MSRDQPRVLVVEDEPAQLEVLAYNLEAEGFAVSRARDGEEAILLIAEDTPDIIVLDWMMPNMVAVNIKQTGAIISLVGDMGIPDFVIDRFGGHKAPSCKIDMVCVWGTWKSCAGSASCENCASSAVEPPR